MKRQDKSNVSDKVGAESPKRKTWFSRVDGIAHKVQGMQTVNLILLAWVISSSAVSFNNALHEQNNVYSQMHAVPRHGSLEPPPPHYLSMDWIMTANRVMTGATATFVGSAVSRELCRHDDKGCNPVWWQTSEGCNASAASILRLPPKVVDEQAYFYRSKRSTFRHLQPMFTCLAEKISDLAVYQNNENSYSIGSTHNANVLVAAVFMICAVVWSTMFIATWRREDDDMDIANEKIKRMVLTGLVVIYIITTYLYASARAIDTNKDQHRPIGLASYAYSTVFLLLSLFVFNQSGTLRDNAREYDRMRGRNRVSPESDGGVTATLVYPAEDPAEDPAPDSALPYTEPTDDPDQGPVIKTLAAMSVRRFVTEPMHTETRIKPPFQRPARAPALEEVEEVSDVTVDVCALISSPVHSKFVYGQLLTLPLALVALSMHGSNFGLDTYTQAVFVCTGVFCFVDVFLYRMWWAFQIHKGVTFYQKNDAGEYHAMEVLTLLCVLLQTAIFAFFIVSELFHETYAWFFVVYIIFASLAKIFAVVAIRQHRRIFDYGGPDTLPSSNFDKLTGTLQKSDFYMFVVYTILLSILLWTHVIQDQRKLDAPWAEKMPLVQHWGPGWQKYNALSI